MYRNFWKNRPVLVTGASGFVGSHLTSHLERSGAKVIGLARRARKGHQFETVDLMDMQKLEQVFAKSLPFACFHLGGITSVEEGQIRPYETFKTNFTSTLNILELCRRFKVSRIVVASTVHVYGNSPLPYHEDEPPRPSRPYETSKTCTDLVAQSYADAFHLPVLIPRFVNIYGPGDLNFNRVIPKTIRSVLQGKDPTIWGGQAQREYLYIDDAVAAYDLLAQISDVQIERNRIYNFGTGELISVSALMRNIISLTGVNAALHKIATGRPDELPKQLVSWGKAKRVLGWKPKVKLINGLKLTIDWYQNYFKM